MPVHPPGFEPFNFTSILHVCTAKVCHPVKVPSELNTVFQLYVTFVSRF